MIRPMTTATGLANLLASVTGSQIAFPYTAMVPEVTTIEIIEIADIVVGNPQICPVTCLRWLAAKRVKSDMFSDRVAQNAIIPISEGMKTGQKRDPQPSFGGWEKIGPKPPTRSTIQAISARNPAITSGAAQFSNRRIMSMPRQMISIWITQKIANDSHIVHGYPPKTAAVAQPGPASLPTMTKIAWPPIQVWMPNHPQAMNARAIAARLAPRSP